MTVEESTTPSKQVVHNNSTDSDSDASDDGMFPPGVFDEPVGFRPPSPQPTQTYFSRLPENVQPGTPSEFVVNLPAKHSLWGHRLWNAGKSMTNYLDNHKDLYHGKTVLELGAAAALPSLICALNGAKKVVITDYPDPGLIKNITKNAKDNMPHLLDNGVIRIEGFIWGDDPSHLLAHLDPNTKFDVILLADVVFNHNQHHNLLKTCRDLLSPTGFVFTTFTHHVVKWAYRDMAFFDIAADPVYGFVSEKTYEEKWDCMFPDDEGDVEVRSTVHAYMLRR